MKKIISAGSLLVGFLFLSCQTQVKENAFVDTKKDKIVGDGCDGCELMYDGMPDSLSKEHTSIGWNEGKQKLIVTGKLFLPDGKTPASDVIVYYWHTDDKGKYTSDESQTKAIAHGKIRGWVKTDSSGEYTIKTSRPAAYPNDAIPQHIHLAIKEPNITNEYFADLYFDDDQLYLYHKKKYGKQDRAGSELLRVVLDNGIQIAEHNIILGLNIPNYPIKRVKENYSGLNIGEDQPSFSPFHAFGPDKSTRTCPVCKYGRYHGILFFAGDNINWQDVKKWLKFLDDESIKREKYLKAYFIYANSKDKDLINSTRKLEEIGTNLNLQKIALTIVSSFTDEESEVHLCKINPDFDNTIIIYKHRTIVDKYINLKPSEQNFILIKEVLDKTRGNHFDKKEPQHY